MGHGVVVHRRLLLRVEDVVRYVARFEVCAVFEQVLAYDVAQRPDAGTWVSRNSSV